jgi:hypothetical protein
VSSLAVFAVHPPTGGGITQAATSVARVLRLLLPVWFTIWTLRLLVPYAQLGLPVGFDARIYHQAALAALAGGNPWTDTHLAAGFAGPPPMLLPFYATSLLGETGAATIWVVAAAISAVLVLRRVGLPLWWLLFPPLSIGIWSGNPNLPVVALLLASSPVADAAASVLKIYSLIPSVLLGRLQGVVLTLVVLVVTAPLVPWATFLETWPKVQSTLAEQSPGLSAWPDPILLALAAVGLLLVGRERAAWWAVPSVWPSTQIHYAALALPAMSLPGAYLLSLPLNRGAVAIGVLLTALLARFVPDETWLVRSRTDGRP